MGSQEERQAWKRRRQRKPRAAQKGNHEGRPAWETRRQEQPRKEIMKGDKLGRPGGRGSQAHVPMLVATSRPKGAKANQPKKARKKEIVAAQNARICGFCCTVPQTRSSGNSVALLLSSTANLKSDIASASGSLLRLPTVSVEKWLLTGRIAKPMWDCASKASHMSTCHCINLPYCDF